jgi:hypothetical protein
LQGCFFVWIPGSLMQAAGDAITGAEGNHCVATTATVGSAIRLPDGTQWKVESLSGTSARCQRPEQPIRAKLAPA